jgi:hypothetical protein
MKMHINFSDGMKVIADYKGHIVVTDQPQHNVNLQPGKD